jgi:hypothetical protein
LNSNEALGLNYRWSSGKKFFKIFNLRKDETVFHFINIERSTVSNVRFYFFGEAFIRGPQLMNFTGKSF